MRENKRCILKEIRKKLYNLIENDPTIRGYIGHSITDPRIYLIWPPENIELTVTTPAKISVNYTEPGGIPTGENVEGAQYPDGYFFIDVWARGVDLRDDIVERIEEVFKHSNRSDLGFDTTNYRIMRMARETKDNTVEIHPGTQKIASYRTHLRYRVGSIYRK